MLCSTSQHMSSCTSVAAEQVASAEHAISSALLVTLYTAVPATDSCLHGSCDTVQPLSGSWSTLQARARLTKAAFLQKLGAKLVLWQLNGAIPI